MPIYRFKGIKFLIEIYHWKIYCKTTSFSCEFYSIKVSDFLYEKRKKMKYGG